jgi:hypothetical protein
MAGTAVAITVGDATPLLDDNGSGVYVKGRNTAHDIRLGLLGSLFQQSSDGITPRAGVLLTFWDGANYDFAAVPAGTPDQTLTMKRGHAIVPRAGQGAYLINMETDQVITMPAASASNSRVDLVCLAAFDKGNFVGDAAHGPNFWIEQGALGGGAPATPTGMLKLFEVARAVNDNAISAGEITDRRYVTGVNQGIRPYVGSEVNGSGIIGAAGVYPNEVRFGPTMLERWNISTNLWDPLTFPLGQGYAEYSLVGAQTIATSTDQRHLFDTTVVATSDVTTATVAGGTEFTINRAGVWLIEARTILNGAAGSGDYLRAAVLSTTSAIANRFGGNNTWAGHSAPGAPAIAPYNTWETNPVGQKRFAVGDKFSLWLWQQSGGGLAVNVTWPPRISMTWLRP